MSTEPSRYAQLSQDAVYPSHPVVVALCIMGVFDNLDAASAKSERTDYPLAMSHEEVPGAGSNVRAALDLLRFAQTHTPEEAWMQAEDIWAYQVGTGTGNHENQHAPGKAQALTYRDQFLHEVKTWGHPAPTITARPSRRP